MSGRGWYPLGARHSHSLPEVGTILAADHAAWRVVAVNSVPRDLWTDEDFEEARRWESWEPRVFVVRPIHIAGDDPRARDHDRHMRTRMKHHTWYVFEDEHYPVCSKCSEPLPCRESLAIRDAANAAKKMNRYELPGVCPACEEPITPRQRVHTFPDNLMVPLGPPVTFHLRNGCLGTAAKYDRLWCGADASRRPSLFCDGTLTQHGNGTRECSEIGCPGLRATHPHYDLCRCPRERVDGHFVWACTPLNEVTA